MFVRKLTKNLKDQNWTVVGIDLLIVVAGVFIGLEAQSWNTERVEQKREQLVLQQIETALASDLEDVQFELDRFRQIDNAATELLDHIGAAKPYDQSLDHKFGLIYGFSHVNLDRAAYESLKSDGLDLISDDSLRTEVARVYEKSYNQLEKSMYGEREVVLYLRPYFLENFKDLRFSQSATPINYSNLLEDNTFKNLIDYRLQAVRANQIQNLERAEREMRTLIEAIDKELED